jgi:hypothetical protein
LTKWTAHANLLHEEIAMVTVKRKVAPAHRAPLQGSMADRLAKTQLDKTKGKRGAARQLDALWKDIANAIERAQAAGRGVRFTIDLTPEGEVAIGPIEQADSQADVFSEEKRTYSSELDRALHAARQRGEKRVAEIVAEKNMLSADEMAQLLGTTRMTVNTKRRNHQLLGLEGAKRGYRFPQWQIGADGKPFEALPALFDRLGGSPWAVYRFLVQRHAELGGLTGREALAKGRSAQTIEAAESVVNAFS